MFAHAHAGVYAHHALTAGYPCNCHCQECPSDNRSASALLRWQCIRKLLHLFVCPVCKHCLMLIQCTACFCGAASGHSITRLYLHTHCNCVHLGLSGFHIQPFVGSTLAALFTVPLSKKRKRESDQQQQQQKRQAPNGTHKPFPPSHYRVTLQQMESNDYPMPVVDKQGIMTCPTAYVATQPAGDVFSKSNSCQHCCCIAAQSMFALAVMSLQIMADIIRK